MKAALEALHKGRMGWAAFFAATSTDWDRLARHVHRRWKLPAAIDAEDVAQELKLGAMRAARRWRRDKVPFPNFVLWTAIRLTNKWLHNQRNALRRDGKAPSRIPHSFSEFEHEPDAVQDEVQSVHSERFERVADALRQLDDLGQRVLVAVILAKGDVEGAADDVYEDGDVRRVLRLDSRADARRVVRRIAAGIAGGLAA